MNDEMNKELWEAIDDSATARKLEAKINRLLIEARIKQLEAVYDLYERHDRHKTPEGNAIKNWIAELKKQLGDKR